MARIRGRDRLRFWFDRTMDRGTPALIGWLGMASAVLIAVITVLATLLAPADVAGVKGGWVGVAWMSLLRTLDPGTMGGDDATVFSVPFLVLMLAVTLGGVFIVSSLIGVLVTGVEQRIAQLRKGRAPLIEAGHTVVLGWSDQVFTVVAELVGANKGSRRSSVVILADRDKVDMEDQIRARVGDTGRTRVTCRSGSPLKRIDLDLVSLDTAKAIIVLPPPGDDADIDVIKALLLLNNRSWPTRRPHVVAAVQQSENLAAARLAADADTLVIDAEDITVRIVVQSHRQSGLSTVCTDLLDFAGNGIYLRTEPALAGRTFGDALSAYHLGCPLGLRRGDGTVAVNPPMDTVIATDDQIILLAEGDQLVRMATEPVPVVTAALSNLPDDTPTPVPDRTLLVGWNARGPWILGLLDEYVPPGSVLDIAAPHPPPDEVTDSLRDNLTVGYQVCEPTSRRSLEALNPGSYQHVIVLTDDTLEEDHADDRTLVTLLHLRDIEVRIGDPYSIVTEMNDDTNREIAQVTKADDFIVSSKLISLLLTQLAENRHLQAVFTDLFDPSGSEIYLKPAPDYVTTDTQINFATLVHAARSRGEAAIGYRLHHHADQPPAYGVTLNPPKDTAITLTALDSVIVVAEN
ncbi:CASTOR/POLLUX-related putative ion channel [Nocardia crassostreae]|uniref:CASTOR/POLLUX-related putative ion channel n=1 Tax=Nocardia crassostreae TaxID=53428 RepID=UPI0008320ADC|nr:potassium transporter TrkA [Nocardia crassostreae]